MDTLRAMITRFVPWLKLGYLLLGIGIIYFLLSHHVYDDPFITYRYAENLGEGLGFVYNPGERVLSTTTPLFRFAPGFTLECLVRITASCKFNRCF